MGQASVDQSINPPSNQSKIKQSINQSNQQSSTQSGSESKNLFIIKKTLNDPIKYIKESTYVMTVQV